MKRLYPAVIIIISVCIFYHFFDKSMDRHINNIMETIEKTDKAIIKEDYEKAKNYCKELENRWEDTKKIAKILVDEKEIENTGYYIRQSQNTLVNRNKDDYLIFSDSLKYYIRQLK